MFSPCYFHVIISIGILESNSLSVPYKMALKGVHFLHYYRGDLAPQALNLPYSNVGDELCSTLNLPYISVGTILCSRH